MHAVRIDRFHARYRMPLGGEQRRRLDSILRLVVGEALETALARPGISPREEICIRGISAAVRLRMSAADSALAAIWGQTLAGEIREAAARGASAQGPPGASPAVVRYPSREYALLDVAASVTLDDLTRAWAWRQVELWYAAERPSPAEAVRELVRTLVRHGTMIVPILSALVSVGVFERIAARFEATHWIALAAAALAGADANLDWHDLTRSPVDDPSQSYPAQTGITAQVRIPPAERLLRTSRLARSILHSRVSLQAETTHNRVSLAERLLRTSRLAQLIPRSGVPSQAETALSALILLETEPALASNPPAEVLAILEALRAALFARRLPVEKSRKQTALTLVPRTISKTSIAGQFTATMSQRARTRYGGLLLLLTILDSRGLHRRMLNQLPHRPLKWGMHALALCLVSMEANDPAALAFAGLAPDATPPNRGEEASTEQESGLLEAFQQEVLSELEHRLSDLQLAPEELLEFVCARPAEIVADPGWIEVRFQLDSVSTELRRAALDLDPSYLPWLGMVVKFVYE